MCSGDGYLGKVRWQVENCFCQLGCDLEGDSAEMPIRTHPESPPSNHSSSTPSTQIVSVQFLGVRYLKTVRVVCACWPEKIPSNVVLCDWISTHPCPKRGRLENINQGCRKWPVYLVAEWTYDPAQIQVNTLCSSQSIWGIVGDGL